MSYQPWAQLSQAETLLMLTFAVNDDPAVRLQVVARDLLSVQHGWLRPRLPFSVCSGTWQVLQWRGPSVKSLKTSNNRPQRR